MAVVHVHLADGSTRSYDVSDQAAAGSLAEDLSSQSVQDTATSVSVNCCGRLHSMARPRGFGQNVRLHFEHLPPSGGNKGAERISWFSGDVRLSMVVHSENGACKTALTRTGRMVFGPSP